MLKVGKTHISVLPRFLWNFVLLCALFAIIVPPKHVCACACCGSEEKTIDPEPVKSSCCSSSKLKKCCSPEKHEKKSCCSSNCRCSDVDEHGRKYPCNCTISGLDENLFFVQNDNTPPFINQSFIGLTEDNGDVFAYLVTSFESFRPPKVRLHLLICVFRN